MYPIINPWFFYLLEIYSNILTLPFITVVVVTIAVGYYNHFELEGIKKIIKWGLIVFAITSAVVFILPSEKTMYKMLISSYVTPQNLELADGDIDNLIEKIEYSVYKKGNH